MKTDLQLLEECIEALGKDRDEWKEESALHQKEHERLARKIEAIEKKALEIIPGYGNTGKSQFTTPIAVMDRMKDEIDLLRAELAKADTAMQDNIATFIDLREQVEDLRKSLKTAIQWIDDGTDQEGRDLIVEPFRAKYFPPKADPSLDSENGAALLPSPAGGSDARAGSPALREDRAAAPEAPHRSPGPQGRGNDKTQAPT